MEFKDLFVGREDNLLYFGFLPGYFHYFGDMLSIHDSIGRVSMAVNIDQRPVFVYTIEAGSPLGEKYVFPTLKNLQPVTDGEFRLYVKGNND